MRSYDAIAPFYDKLAKLIFGNTIQDAQSFLTNFINPFSKILIIGGGTGWIIDEIASRRTSGLQITYIDVSKKMIDISKKRNFFENKIDFINHSFFDVPLEAGYDAVITPFFLDNFNDKKVEIIMDKINNCLLKNGLWLYADFQVYKNSMWQKALLKSMYIFFKVACNIEASRLTETQSKFKKRDYDVIALKKFYSNFICSIVYQKLK